MHALVVMGTLPGSGVAANTDSLSLLATPLLTTFLGDHKTIRRIGRLYLREFPRENNIDVLVRSLLQRSSSHSNLSTMIDISITHDFHYENTILLDGWVLARTEARQAALYSLIHP